MISNPKKALIHVAKKQVGMTEEEYRDLLGSVGVKSSKDLNGLKFSQVMKRFEKLGFKSIRSKKKLDSKTRLIKKIEALITDLGITPGYVDAIARHMFQVDAYKWCNAHQLHKIVAALSINQKRKKGYIYK